MTDLGIFSGYFPGTVAEVAAMVARLGYKQVQLDLRFPDVDLSPGNVTRAKADAVREQFESRRVKPVVISGYINLVDPKVGRREGGLAALREMLVHAHDFGARYVATEAGTRSLINQFAPDPSNDSDEAFANLVETLRGLLQTAREHGVVLLLEPYVNHVVGSVDAAARVLDHLADEGLRILLDPANFFERHNIGDMDSVLELVFDRLGPFVEVVHAKDVALAPEYSAAGRSVDIGLPDPIEGHTFRGIGAMVQPAAGLGDLNYELFLQLYRNLGRDIPLIIEHITYGDGEAVRAREFISSGLNRLTGPGACGVMSTG